jgi:hypothetical protein
MFMRTTTMTMVVVVVAVTMRIDLLLEWPLRLLPEWSHLPNHHPPTRRTPPRPRHTHNPALPTTMREPARC